MRLPLAMALLLAAGPLIAQYGQPPATAAPSTIPGQGPSAAQVPQVAPAQQPVPQRDNAASPWGGSPYGSGGYGTTGNSGTYGSGSYGSGSTGSGTPYGSAGSASPYGRPSNGGSPAPTASGSPPASGSSPAGYPSPSSPPASPRTTAGDDSGAGAAAMPPTASTRSAAASRSALAVVRQGDAGPRPPAPGTQASPAESARANAELQESFRQLGDDESVLVSSAVRNNNAAVRVQGGSGQGSSVLDSTRDQRIAAPALICAQNGNTPQVSRVRPAAAGGLAPGAAFIVQGLCYGSAPGTLRVMLPTALGRIRAVDAAVLSWESGKLFAELPADLQNVVPGEATVEVWTADGRRSAAQPVSFEPHWALVPLPAVAARVQACTEAGEGSYSRCRVNDDTEADPRFSMPVDCRNNGIGTCFGHDRGDPQAAEGAALIFGQHYTQDVVRFRREPPKRSGRDQFELTLPPWLRPSHCSTTVRAFETEPGTQDAKASARFEGNTVLVDWSFERSGEPGWLQYQAHCQVWAPVGLVMR